MTSNGPAAAATDDDDDGACTRDAKALQKTSADSKRAAATEFEQLLSSTIISLLEKFVTSIQRRDIKKKSPKSSEEEQELLSTSRSLEIPNGDNYFKTTGLDDDEGNFDILDIESQPSVLDSTVTPKVTNLKTTGLDLDANSVEEQDGAIDIESSSTPFNNNSSYYHHHQQSQQKRPIKRQHSNSTDYLPQSAAMLLDTLQHTNFDRNAEEILSSILKGGSSYSFDGDDLDGDKEDEVDDEDVDNTDNTTSNQQDCSISGNSFAERNERRYDDDDDNSISGDMARLSNSIAHLQRDLDNIDIARFDGMLGTEHDGDLLDCDQDGDIASVRWKRWIGNWLLSHGIINDEKVVNSLLSDDESGSTTPGRAGFTIFDFGRDHVLILTLLLVFFVLLRNRFQTVNDLFEDDNHDFEGLLKGSDW